MSLRAAAAAFLFLVMGVTGSDAQTRGDDPLSNSRIRFGPLGLTPSVTLGNLGIDSNVFNSTDEPKEDLTATLSPALDSRFRAGPTRLTVQSTADFVYFRRYQSERSIDRGIFGRYEWRMARVTPWVEGSISHTRQRSGYEIDARASRELQQREIGVDVAVRPKTRVSLSARRQDYSFDHTLFFGSDLGIVLNRREEGATASVFHDLTPLTTLVVDADARRDRFRFAPERNADSVRLLAGFDIAPFALISGRLRVGVRKYDGMGKAISDYRGLVGSAKLATTIRGRLHVTAELARDVDYSYTVELPYYLLTGADVEVTHQFTRLFDVQVRGGSHSIAYRGAPLNNASRDRVDYVQTLGPGVGVHAGRVRIGVNADETRRDSTGPLRAYRTRRVWTAVTYGR